MRINKTEQSDELVDIDLQIQQTVQDLGRLSSFNQNTGGKALSSVRQEKMMALRFLREKRTSILKRDFI
jgi:hypothetical protein